MSGSDIAEALRDLVNDPLVRATLEPRGQHTRSCVCTICRARRALRRVDGLEPSPIAVSWSSPQP